MRYHPKPPRRPGARLVPAKLPELFAATSAGSGIRARATAQFDPAPALWRSKNHRKRAGMALALAPGMLRIGSAIGIAWLTLACSAPEDSKADQYGTGGAGASSGASGAGGASAGAGTSGAGTGGVGTGGAPVELPGCTPGGPIGSAYAYFDTLRSRPDCHVALSLRDAGQLAPDLEGGYSGHGKPVSVTYDPANDSYPDAQDAAKIVIPAEKNSLPNQVKLPILIYHGDRGLITWDAWFGPELDFSNTGIPTYKMWQFSSHNDDIWCEVRARWKLGPNLGGGALAAVDGRTYSTVGPSVTSKSPLEPQIGLFTLYPKRWVRYWGLFEPAGEYDVYSLWVADEQTDPVQLFDRLELQFRSNKDGTAVPRLGKFRIEFNTSHNALAPERGELVAYARNYVVLKGDFDLATILERPQF
jgi:hypothetical protein